MVETDQCKNDLITKQHAETAQKSAEALWKYYETAFIKIETHKNEGFE